jgi:transient receptor potential cation channel subfamily C
MHYDFGFHIAQVQKEMAAKMQTTELPREDWDTWDPMLISEGLFSAANIFR